MSKQIQLFFGNVIKNSTPIVLVTLFSLILFFSMSVSVTYAATTGAVTYSPSRAVKAGDSLLITATFSNPLVDTPVVKIAISGGDSEFENNAEVVMTPVAMTKIDTTHYTYTRIVKGGTSGLAKVAFSDGTDAAGNVVTATPTVGGTYSVDNVAPLAFTTGAVTAAGGIVVPGKWNSTNTGVNIAVPVDNEPTTVGGKIQILAGVGGFQYINNPYTIQEGDLNGNKIISITRSQLEAMTNENTLNEGVSVQFIAEVTDVAGNKTTGKVSLTKLTVDRLATIGPVAYWDFSEGNGNVIHDKVGSSDGVIYGATWIDGALNFNGLNNYVKIPDTPALNPASAITISMWIKPLAVGGIALTKEEQYRLIAEDVSQTKLSARVHTTGKNWGIGVIAGYSSLTINDWQHVALTYDGSKWKLYYNGQLDTEIEDSGEIAPTHSSWDSNLYLGNTGPVFGTGRDEVAYNGLIDDVKIYNRALSANEIIEDSSHRTTTSIPQVCSSWQYSDWSTCSSSGNQTRSVTSSSPSNCTGGSPVLSQSCTYTPPVPSCTAADWSCGSWSICSQNGNQARECSKKLNCQGGVSSATTSQSCTYVAPSCAYIYSDFGLCQPNNTKTRTVASSSPVGCVGTPILSQSCTYVAPIPSCTSYNYSQWSECSPGGKQTRNVTSKYPYNCENGELPKTTQSCTYIPPAPTCDADTWTCDNWNSCSLSGVQNRSCKKTFDCPSVETAPPTVDQYCEAPNRPVQQVPQDSDAISNQDTIIKATVKLLCVVDENRGMWGSGTVIDSSGTILTNKHVVDGTVGCLVGFVSDFNDEPYFGDRQIADILKVSPTEDVATVKIRNPQNKKLSYVNVANSNSNIRLGTRVNIYGYPARFGTTITYTSGDFSGTDGSYLKTTAIIEHGNSGGGSYLNDGSFIGIPTGVIKGELNAMGYILSINTINAWLGNSNIASRGSNNQNNYSRVSSVLESIDLKKLDSIKLLIPKTDDKGNNIIPPVTSTTNQSAQPTTRQPQTSQPQRESTVIESSAKNQKTNPSQDSPVLSEKEPAEEKGSDSSINIPEQRRSTVADAVQEMVKVAERNGGVGQEIKTIAQVQVQNQEKLETSLQKVQSRSGFAKFFVGPNYSEINNAKKLLEQNREQIKQLDEVQNQLTNKSDKQKLTEQVKLLEQTNQEIENSLNTSQKGFSLFGWVFRLFTR